MKNVEQKEREKSKIHEKEGEWGRVKFKWIPHAADYTITLSDNNKTTRTILLYIKQHTPEMLHIINTTDLVNLSRLQLQLIICSKLFTTCVKKVHPLTHTHTHSLPFFLSVSISHSLRIPLSLVCWFRLFWTLTFAFVSIWRKTCMGGSLSERQRRPRGARGRGWRKEELLQPFANFRCVL